MNGVTFVMAGSAPCERTISSLTPPVLSLPQLQKPFSKAKSLETYIMIYLGSSKASDLLASLGHQSWGSSLPDVG